ncbi:jg5979 [Pararge aegeria aegeria]|uniref:Jg5979 protein n=1 Tax=Pararge aegeria aegeria TaxID=348720 RepID=A0A8S4S5N5_9NEOP|nr:jg5979 [Pararge aegeria aegeria]
MGGLIAKKLSLPGNPAKERQKKHRLKTCFNGEVIHIEDTNIPESSPQCSQRRVECASSVDYGLSTSHFGRRPVLCRASTGRRQRLYPLTRDIINVSIQWRALRTCGKALSTLKFIYNWC